MIVTFCGHACFHKTEEYERKMLGFLEEKVGSQAADMYLGGYGAFDSFAYDCCKKYQETHPKVSLLFITPYMTVKYQKNQLHYKQMIYDGIIYPEIENKPTKFAIFYRNKWMMEKADYVVAYVEHDWGRAYAIYKYAKRMGKVIFNITDFE